MLKPLLRTIPLLSGNIKLTCSLSDYVDAGDNTYIASIRYATMQPLSSSTMQYNVKANLVGSTWDHDINRYYNYYSDIFFSECFDYNKVEMKLLDRTEIMNARNTDFEYGVKRVSYSKSGYQYAVFAPFYFEGVDDIPSYFMLNIVFKSDKYAVTKQLKINVGDKGTKSENYLATYLYNYGSILDSNVIFMNPTGGCATYDAIDLVHGGFTKKVDTTISSIFKNQLPIQ